MISNNDRIFDVSIDLFSEYGYDGVSIRKIAGEVGIKESSIYNHYRSKESILDSILDYYISEMVKVEIPLEKAAENMDVGFDYFYKAGLEAYKSKLAEPRMMKITRIILIESYHNEKIKNYLKTSIIKDAIDGWTVLFDVMKEKRIITMDSDSRQLAQSFFYYGLFLLIEHFIINYPEDDDKFLEEFALKSQKHMKLIFNSVRIGDEMNIRLENENDYFEVEKMVRDSFWNIYRPGAFEHYIVHNLRNDESFINNLAYVIEIDDHIIGHINYSWGKIRFENGKIKSAAVLGPLSIDRNYQKRGYGTDLVEFTLDLLEKKGIPYVFVIGDENYYRRFGFKSASAYGVFLQGTDTNDECPFFMIKVFDEDAIDFNGATFSNPDVFDVDESDVDEFDRKFEYKQKKVLKGQLEV